MPRKPLAASEFYFALQLSLVQFNAHSNEPIELDWWRRPRRFFNNQLHGLKTFATLFVVAVANTNQFFAVMVEKFLALQELPEAPQHLVISNPEELEAFQIEPDSLKQMRHIRDSITSPFEDFDLVVQALLKAARLAVEKVVGDLIQPVVERRQKGIKAFQATLLYPSDPVGNGAHRRFFALLGVKDRAQLFAQVIGFAQVRRAFQQQRDGLLLLRLKIGGVAAERPHRAFEQFVFLHIQALLQFAQLAFAQLVGALTVRLGHMKTINHHLGLRDLFFDRVGVAFVHVGADALNTRPQFERDRTQESRHRLFLPVRKHAEQRNVTIPTLQSDDHNEIAVTFAQRDLIHPDDFQCRELAPVDRACHASIDRPQNRVITDLLLARHVTDRAVDQLPQQRLIKGSGVWRARLVPLALLRSRRMIVASRTAVTLRAQLNEHALLQTRQVPQADRSIVAVKVKGLLTTAGADRIRARTLDRDDDLSLFQFSFQNADFRQVQRKFDHWRHRSVPFKEDWFDLSLPQLQPRSKITRCLGLFGSSQRAKFLDALLAWNQYSPSLHNAPLLMIPRKLTR